ncbi:P-loop containing nucleoside triphosphate hydrolase protein [Infundibulicybe gibba]|nr:P-loop containing nucleoside triphosphate hydrolase protein [Infundibulicybe gibba]
MKSLTAPSTRPCFRQPWWAQRGLYQCPASPRRMSRSAELMARSSHASPEAPPQPCTFASLGLHPPIIAALQLAFPNVRTPTETQEKFIPAILTGKDILLKDATGSGKSFGLPHSSNNFPSRGNHITSLVVVPHRDLAYQLLHWVQRITCAAPSQLPLESIAQVVVRDGQDHLKNGIPKLQQVPPHILIGTPQAIIDIWRKSPEVLQLSQLSSVVIDEADYLIETVPKKDPKKSFRGSFIKTTRRLMAHPGVTRELLDIIYARRKEAYEHQRDESGLVQHRRRSGFMAGLPHSPQLIFSSATLRSHLNDYLFDESGWLNRDNILKVKGLKTPIKTITSFEGRYPHDGLGGTNISHSILIVSDDGISNIPDALQPVSSTPESEGGEALTPEAIFGVPTDVIQSNMEAQLTQKYDSTPSPFNPNAFEAIATAFALDVPSIAMLVLPSSAPVQRAVHDLRSMGVNAQSLDLLTDEKGRSHLLSGSETVQENPTLLVATLATIRGIDLPELTHVFILGVPEGPKVTGRSVDAYLHVAGRVGRFGRGGKVITVVEKGDDAERSDVSRMARILKTIEIAPVRFEHFD